MSRAPADTFAAFFPNAPSVLQQKRKRTSPSTRNILPNETASYNRHVTPNSFDKAGKVESDIFIRKDDHSTSLSPPLHEDGPKANAGDTLHGAGSDSSLASTVSSVFSNGHSVSGAAGPTSDSHTLTPVTNTELSPPRKIYSPSSNKNASEQYATTNGASRTQLSCLSETSSLSRNARDILAQACPSPGTATGFRALYDPELDPKLSGKERKKHKVRYRTFGEEVRIQVTDPRSMFLLNRIIYCEDKQLTIMYSLINRLPQILD